MAKIRKVDEVRADVAAIEQEIAALQAKAEAEGLTEEETARLAELVAQLEAAKQEEVVAEASARYAKIKERDQEVKRTLPSYVAAEKEGRRLGDFFGHWIAVGSSQSGPTPETVAKLRSANVDPHSNFLTVPFDWRRLAFKNRTVMTTVATGAGAELDYKTYHDVAFQHLTFETPLLGFLNTINLDNGRERYFYDYDDTAMESTDITAGGGSEASPTIPETNIVTGKQSIKPKSITSGYQKVSLELQQDSPFSIEDKVSAASNRSHGRKMVKDIITANGDGVTNVEGLRSLVDALPSVDEWDLEALESLWDAQPEYYRDGSIFVSNGKTKGDVRRTLKDTTGRTFFDRLDVGPLQFDSLFGHAWVVDKNVPDDEVLFINPAHYSVVIVNNQVFRRFDEKFFSHVAWAGIMRFGAARTGSEDAFHSLTVDAGS